MPAHKQVYVRLSKSDLGNSFKSEPMAKGVVVDNLSRTYNFSPEATSTFRERIQRDEFWEVKHIVRSIDDSHLIIGRFIGNTTYNSDNRVVRTDLFYAEDDAPGIPDFKNVWFQILTLAKDGDNCRKNPLTGAAHLQRYTLSIDFEPSLKDIIHRQEQGNPYACSKIEDLLLANAKKDELIYPEANASDLEILSAVTKEIIDKGLCTK